MSDYATIEAARERFEARLLPTVTAALTAVGEEAASLLERGRDPEQAARIEVAADVLAFVYTTVAPPFADAALAALRPPIKDTHNIAPSWMDRVRSFLVNEAAVMVRAITDTLRDEIRTVLRRGVEEGHSVSRLARDLREAWPDVARRRATVIVRTEVIAASNQASRWGFERTAADYGIEMELEWLATQDGRVRDSHSAADGQRVPIDGAFTIGGYSAKYPGDPALPASERIQCRCAIVAVPVERKALTWREERDEKMRLAYEPLKAKRGAEVAYCLLGEEYGLQPDTVRKVVHRIGPYA